MTLRQTFYGGRTGHVTTIKEEVRLDGVWWLPGHPDADVGGQLIITPSHGAYLSLHGVLGEVSEDADQKEHDLILGLQSNGYPLTLHRSREVRRTRPLNWKHLTQRFAVETVYGGLHVEDVSELAFDRFYFSFTFLSDWLRNVGLGIEGASEVDGGFFVPYDREKSTTVSELTATFGEIDLAIKSKPVPFGRWGGEDGGRAGVRLYEGAEASTAKPMPLEEVMQAAIVPLRDFLSLATCQPNTLARLTAKRESDPHQRVEIYVQMPYERVNPWRLFNKQEVILYANDLRHEFETTFRRWLELEAEMRDVCEWFYGAHYPSGAIPADRFLNVVKAAESYHRTRFGTEMVDPKKYEETVNAFLASTTEELPKWLEQKLKTGNVMPLGSRLGQLVKKAKPASRDIIPDPGSFCKAVVQTRNYYSHLDRSGKSCVVEGEGLELLTETLLWLVRLHLLQEIGISADRAGEAASKSKRFLHLKHLARQQPHWC